MNSLAQKRIKSALAARSEVLTQARPIGVQGLQIESGTRIMVLPVELGFDVRYANSWPVGERTSNPLN